MFDHDADRRRESGLHVFKTLAEAMKPPATPEPLARMTERDKTDLLHALAADLGMVVSRKEPRPLSEPLNASAKIALAVWAWGFAAETPSLPVGGWRLPPVPGFRPPYGPTAEETVLDRWRGSAGGILSNDY